MTFRFTLNNTIAGSHPISEPDGWKDIAIKLDRSPEFHSLVEMIETPFFFYNVGQGKDGGRQYLYNIERTQGINAIVTLKVEVTEDGTAYDVVYQANLDLSTITDTSKGDKFYRLSCTLKPIDLWAMFINRRGTKVDLNSVTDLDGNASPTINKIELALTSQKIRQVYQGVAEQVYSYGDIPISTYVQYDFDNELINEIATKYNLPISENGSPPSALWVVDLPGVYTFEIQIVAYDVQAGPAVIDLSGKLNWGLGLRNNVGGVSSFTNYSFARTDVPSGATFGYTIFTLNQTITLAKGDEISLYGFSTFHFDGITNILYISGLDNVNNGPYANIPQDIHANVTADTTYPDSNCDAILIHDAASAIVKRIAPGFDIYSDYFGGSFQGYGSNGCGYLYALLLGLHVRGYSFAEKPFAISFNDWWTGANPIFNLGIGQETVGGIEVIRIERKDHFYDDTPILAFSYVEGIERSYDQSMIFKSVEQGYGNWSAESASGIDDPQTTHSYSTIFKIIGTEISNLSSWFAASLGIEQTRRNKAEKGKDWRLDNNIMVISIDKSQSASPELFIPEIGSPFNSITGLFNAATRYNIRITPYMNFKRWIRFYSVCLQSYLSSVFRFNQSEGNSGLAVGSNADSCDGGAWVENQNISPSSNPYFTYEMWLLPKVTLTWTDYKTLLANRYRCIEVSQGATDYKKIHIQSLKYDIAHARATIKGWVK